MNAILHGYQTELYRFSQKETGTLHKTEKTLRS